ncbi:Yae1-like protein [Microdochium nivale]|nr:Yae1-like protein [Microdochium nivale]
MSADDLFDDVLNLEDQYYQEGYDEGLKDGVEAGKIEGRSVGLKSGFEKFLEAGRLQGRALVWANRLPSLTGSSDGGDDASSLVTLATSSTNTTGATHAATTSGSKGTLSSLPNANARLEKNVVTLYGLLEPGTLSTQNGDEDVNDFDSRLKGAQGKAKIIDRAIGEKISLPE